MKVVLCTNDLFAGREHLMPWRTLLEVGKRMSAAGIEVEVLNSCCEQAGRHDYAWEGVDIRAISAGAEARRERLTRMRPDVAYIPVTWRGAWHGLKACRALPCRKIAYLPGAVYDLGGVRALWKEGGWRAALPYFAECLMPKRLLGRALRAGGFEHTVALTELTAERAHRSGCPSPVCIPAGKDAFHLMEEQADVLGRLGLAGQKYLLFSGAPAATRGATLLLDAIDRCPQEIYAAFLMRTDVGSDFRRFEAKREAMAHPERVNVVRQRLSREELKTCFAHAWAGLLPFVVVPSEVPLTFYEYLSCGTPVVAFAGGGTADALQPALFLAQKKTARALAETLARCWDDTQGRGEKSAAAQQLMAAHPDWDAVAERWIDLTLESE